MFKKILQRIGMKGQLVCMCGCVETGQKRDAKVEFIYMYVCMYVEREREKTRWYRTNIRTANPFVRTFFFSFSHTLVFLKLFIKASRFSTFEFYSRRIDIYGIFIHPSIYPSIRPSVHAHIYDSAYFFISLVCVLLFRNGGTFYVHTYGVYLYIHIYVAATTREIRVKSIQFKKKHS